MVKSRYLDHVEHLRWMIARQVVVIIVLCCSVVGLSGLLLLSHFVARQPALQAHALGGLGSTVANTRMGQARLLSTWAIADWYLYFHHLPTSAQPMQQRFLTRCTPTLATQLRADWARHAAEHTHSDSKTPLQVAYLEQITVEPSKHIVKLQGQRWVGHAGHQSICYTVQVQATYQQWGAWLRLAGWQVAELGPCQVTA